MDILFNITKLGVTAVYISCILILCIFGLNRFYLIYLRNKKSGKIKLSDLRFTRLPRVTVQLPIYNEYYVIKRLINSVCNIDYPGELLEIQVLDDSTDNTANIAKNLVEQYRSRGININYLHRDKRLGFKAGALENGLRHSTGDLIAIFDADFIPPKDFLSKTVHYFSNENVGIVQARWGHLNRYYSSLTKAQSILLDGHFAIEQQARYQGEYFLNFNGTAGLIRKKSIIDSGGWQHDTLTEDLDLSYRIQLSGWKIVYVNDLTVDAELPVDINSFKSQQHRWAKGGTQTALKLLPGILKNRELSLGVKIESGFHLLANFSYPLLLMLILLMLPMAYLWQSLGWQKVILLSLVAVTTGTVSVFNFYYAAIRSTTGKKWKDLVIYIPLSIALGSGIVINNTKAVIEALLNINTEFKRTPKFAVIKNRLKSKSIRYKSSYEFIFILELLFGFLFLTKTLYAVQAGYYGWIPFLIIIQFGFLYSSILSIIHSRNIHIPMSYINISKFLIPKPK